MNMQILRWLLRNSGVLTEVAGIVKGIDYWSLSLPEKWEITQKIGDLLVPALADMPKSLAYMDDDFAALSLEQSEVSALGVDWATMIEVILPLVIAILRALMGDRPTDD